MATYMAKRLLAAIPVLLLTSITIFVLMRVLPGDPLIVVLGQTHAEIRPEVLQQVRIEYGLDKPIYIQYLQWVSKVVRGDFGRSVQTHQPVIDIVKPRLLPTIQIGLEAWLFAVVLAIPIGIISAISPNSWKDSVGTVGALVGAAIPYFLLGGVLIYIVVLRLKWLPASGYASPFTNPTQSLKLSILPALTLGAGLAAGTTRQTRSSFLEVLHQSYITTARAKGLREKRVVLGHAFKNAMLPVVTILGIQLGNLIGGAVITETIFSIPGIGRLLVQSIFDRDYPVVQGVVLFIAFGVILSNLAVDMMYSYLDPRIRY